MRNKLWLALAVMLAVMPLLGAFGGDAAAATSRVAVIKELKGSVKVKKSGGSKEFTAFAKMSLNEGDVLSVGGGGSAVLQFANGTSDDDKMSVGANSTLTFSKLSDRDGTTTKVSLWSGSAWVDVKSIKSKEDDFTLETPTAIMGVRGTHLLVSVDANTGATKLTVAAGVVSTQTTGDGDAESRDVYPTENALITGDGETEGEITIAPVDLETLVKQSDKSIVDAIIQASGEIVLENNEKIDQYLSGQPSGTPEDSARKKANVESILGAIVDSAVKNGLITQERVNQLVSEAQQQLGVTIDLAKKEQKLSDEEKARQEEQKKKDQAALEAAELRKKQEKEKQDAEAQAKLLEDKKKKEEENKKALEEQRKKAQAEYEKQLSEAQKQKFAEEQKKREQERQQATATPTPTPTPPPVSTATPTPTPVETETQSSEPTPTPLETETQSTEPTPPPVKLSAISFYDFNVETWDPILSPIEFSVNQLSYDLNLPLSFYNLGMSFVSNNPNAQISVTWPDDDDSDTDSEVAIPDSNDHVDIYAVPLDTANTSITITVSAAGSSTTTYTLNVTLVAPDWGTLNPIAVTYDGNILMNNRNVDDIVVTVPSPSGSAPPVYIEVNPVIADSATLKYDGEDLYGEGGLYAFYPVEGDNPIEIRIDDVRGSFKHTYNLNVYQSSKPYGVDMMLLNGPSPEPIQPGSNRIYAGFNNTVDSPLNITLELDSDKVTNAIFTSKAGGTATLEPRTSAEDPNPSASLSKKTGDYSEFNLLMHLKNGISINYPIIVQNAGSPASPAIKTENMAVTGGEIYKIDEESFALMVPNANVPITIQGNYGFGGDFIIQSEDFDINSTMADNYTLYLLGSQSGEAVIKVFDPSHRNSKSYKLYIYVAGAIPDELKLTGLEATYFASVGQTTIEQPLTIVPNDSTVPISYSAEVPFSPFVHFKPTAGANASIRIYYRTLDGFEYSISYNDEIGGYQLPIEEGINNYRIVVVSESLGKIFYSLILIGENTVGPA